MNTPAIKKINNIFYDGSIQKSVCHCKTSNTSVCHCGLPLRSPLLRHCVCHCRPAGAQTPLLLSGSATKAPLRATRTSGAGLGRSGGSIWLRIRVRAPRRRFTGAPGGQVAAPGGQSARQPHTARRQWQTQWRGSGERSGKPQWQTDVFEVLQWQTDFGTLPRLKK